MSKGLINAIIAGAVIYLACAFIAQDISGASWTEDLRIAFVSVTLPIMGVILLFEYLERH